MQALQPAFGSLQSLRFGNTPPLSPYFGADPEKGTGDDSAAGAGKPQGKGGDEFKGRSASEPAGSQETAGETGENSKTRNGEGNPQQNTPPRRSGRNWLLLPLLGLAGLLGWGGNELSDRYQIVPRDGQAAHAPVAPGAADAESDTVPSSVLDPVRKQQIMDAFGQMAVGFKDDADRNSVVHNQGDDNTTIIINGDGNNRVTVGVPERRERREETSRREKTRTETPRTEERRTETRETTQVETRRQQEQETQIGVIRFDQRDATLNQDFCDAFGNCVLGDGTAIVQDPMGDDWFRNTIRRGGGRIIHLEDRYSYGVRINIGGVVVVIRNRDFLFHNGDILLHRGNNIIVRRHGDIVYTRPFR